MLSVLSVAPRLSARRFYQPHGFDRGSCVPIARHTVLIVTHDLSVAATCQRTITIRDGRIADDLSASSRTS